MDTLGDLIRERNAAAYCLFASSDDPDMRYITGFVTHDPVPVICRPGEKPVLIVPQMEADRAERESYCEVRTRAQAGYYDIARTEHDPFRITAAMIRHVADGTLLLPPGFPAGLARILEEDQPVEIDYSQVIAGKRAVKSRVEIDEIARVQQAAEGAMERAITLIRKAAVRDGLLYHDEKSLTSDLIRYEMHAVLLSHGCMARDTIVACGEEAAMPHCTGAGQLKAHEPIVIDIFPRSEQSGYHADMTRTVSRGEPSARVRDLYDSVRQAVGIGEEGLKAGAAGSDLYTRVKDFFTDQGFQTDTEGFTHSLGHGVGLEVHEMPSLSPMGGPLESGHVVTIEPGLYYRGIGGVRIENLLEVTGTGSRRLTRFSEDMIL